MPKSSSSPRPTSLWASIAASLRDDIREGRYTPGHKLPSEAEMAGRFGVNRHTVRRALSALGGEGLVRTRRGSGAFVTAKPTEYAIGARVRFHENVLAEGRHPEKRVLQIEDRRATANEAEALAIAPGADVCAYRGISLADGQPIALVESLFPIDRLPGISAGLATTTSITKALARSGVADYTRRSTRLTAVLASATQAVHLHLREGDPLLRSTGINVDEDANPVEYGRTWFAGDRVTLTLDTGT